MAKAGTRKLARLAGEMYYFTGNPCPNGHVSKRYVCDKSCYACRMEKVEDKTVVKARSQAWYSRNKKLNKERTYEWRLKNSDRDKQNSNAWREKNREKLNARDAEWRSKNKRKFAEAMFRWRKKNPDKFLKNARYYSVIYNALKRGKSGKVSKDELFAILETQNNKCVYCNTDLVEFHFDHIMPISLGGENSIDNIQALCPTCNCRKGKMHPDKFKEKIAAEMS